MAGSRWGPPPLTIRCTPRVRVLEGLLWVVRLVQNGVAGRRSRRRAGGGHGSTGSLQVLGASLRGVLVECIRVVEEGSAVVVHVGNAILVVHNSPSLRRLLHRFICPGGEWLFLDGRRYVESSVPQHQVVPRCLSPLSTIWSIKGHKAIPFGYTSSVDDDLCVRDLSIV